MTSSRAKSRGPRLRDLNQHAHLSDPARKQRYVTVLFDLIAPGYDRFTRIFSFGMDRRWKRLVLLDVAQAQPRPQLVLDLACGTGDLARAAAQALPNASIVGLDVSREMLRVAARTPATGASPRWVAADLLALPVPDHVVDLVLMGYGLRNTPDFRLGLREIFRVLKPGGVLVNLDFYQPEHRLWRRLFLGYLRVAGAAAGWLWHREPDAYAYIAPSIAHFVTVAEFNSALVDAGFQLKRLFPRLGGGIAVHAAVTTGGVHPASPGSG